MAGANDPAGRDARGQKASREATEAGKGYGPPAPPPPASDPNDDAHRTPRTS